MLLEVNTIKGGDLGVSEARTACSKKQSEGKRERLRSLVAGLRIVRPFGPPAASVHPHRTDPLYQPAEYFHNKDAALKSVIAVASAAYLS